MKMKVTIYTLSYDVKNNGTGCDTYGTQAELHEAQKTIIEEDISGGVSEAADEVREFIREGDIDGAWDKWDADIRDPMDTYSVDEKEVEVEAPKELLELLAAAYVTSEAYNNRGNIGLNDAAAMLSAAVETAMPKQ